MTTKLSPLDLHLPDVHIHEILCFQTSSSYGKIQQVLTSSLQKAIEHIPLLASSLVLDTETSLPIISPPHHTTRDILTFYDLSERLSYSALQRVDFQLDECNPTTAPPVEYLSLNRPQPDGLCKKGRTDVFAVAAVMVEGGVVLAVFVNHMAVDAVGLGVILRTWAECCAGDVLECVSLEREGVAKRLGIQEDEVTKEVGELGVGLRVEQEEEHEEIEQPTLLMPEELDQIILHFTASALADLKATLNKELELQLSPHDLTQHDGTTCPPQLTHLTTNSALTALLWCTITACRLQSPSTCNDRTVTSITVPVNLRPRLTPPLPPTYIGNAVAAASPSASRELVVRGATDIKALAQVAQVVQEAVRAIDGDHVHRCFERESIHHDYTDNDNDDELDSRQSDDEPNSHKNSLLDPQKHHNRHNRTPTTTHNPPPPPSLFPPSTTASALTINSWASQPLYTSTWGPDLGKVQHMTRLKPAAEVVLILPKLANGDLQVQVPVEKETCTGLRLCVASGGGDDRGYLMDRWASVLGFGDCGGERERRDSGVGWLEWVGWWRRGKV